MRVTFVTPHTSLSGGVKMIFTFANLLVERGYAVNILSFPPGFGWKNLRRYVRLGLEHSETITWTKFRALLRRNTRAKEGPDWIDTKAKLFFIPDLEERFVPDADAIVSAGGVDGPIVNNYGPSKGDKYVLFQSFGAHGITATEERVAKMPMNKLVVATWLADLLRERFGEPSTYIPCPIDTDKFYRTRTLKNPAPVIGMLHHTARRKGIDDGLAAFSLVRNKYPDAKLVMFGAQGVPRIASEPFCTFFVDPPQSKLRDVYSMCDVWMCPSWTEGFGLTSAEAMACKVALVTTDNGGSRDYAFHEKTALVSPPREPSQLAENIIRLIEEPGYRQDLAQNGYELIRTFTWESAADRLEAALQSPDNWPKE